MIYFFSNSLYFSSLSKAYVHLSNTVTHLDIFYVWICPIVYLSFLTV